MFENIKRVICKKYQVKLKKGILSGLKYDFLLSVNEDEIDRLKKAFAKRFKYNSKIVICDSWEVAERIWDWF